MTAQIVIPKRQICELLGIDYSPEFARVLEHEGEPGVRSEKFVGGGYRAGKSTEGAAEILTHPKFLGGNGLFWIVGGSYKAAAKEMEYLVQWSMKLGKVARFRDPDNAPHQLILQNGTRVETRSSDNPERLASDAPDKILVVEAGQQKELVREAVLGRALEKGATIVYSGTFEDDEGHRTWGWYAGECNRIQDAGNTPKLSFFSLPTWSNRVIFPGGRNDPKILDAETDSAALDPTGYLFSRKYAGIPSGIQYAVYPYLQNDFSRLRELPKDVEWVTSVGGADYGGDHPTALVVVSLSTTKVDLKLEKAKWSDYHVAWVREVWWDGDLPREERGNPARIRAEKNRLQKKYNANLWGGDRPGAYMVKDWGGKVVAGGDGSRGTRIEMVKARHANMTIFYDKDGPGVADAYSEQSKVRKRKMPDGELKLVREADDRTAALEDAVELLDTRPNFRSKTVRLPEYATSSKTGFPSI